MEEEGKVKEWISFEDRLPEDVKDKDIKLSNGVEDVAFLSPHGNIWCDGSIVPIIKTWENDYRTVTHWRDK